MDGLFAACVQDVFAVSRHELFPRRWSCLGHQEPKDRRAKQAHRRNTQKCCRAAKTHSHQAKECGAERSADSGRGSNDALGQIEVTAAVREIAMTSAVSTPITAPLMPSSS